MTRRRIVKLATIPFEDKRTSCYVNNAFNAILNKPDVKDVIVSNFAGVIIKSTMDREAGYIEGGVYLSLYEKALYILQHLDPQDEILGVRIRTKYHETIMTPDKKVLFIVTQTPRDRINEYVEEED